MEPMKPMKPMAPMKPMTPMEPMAPQEKWWPDDWGTPSSVGSQNEFRYAFFPSQHRLLVERGRKLTTYDSEDHDINGVAQSSSRENDLIFTSNGSTVALSALKEVA